MCQPGVGNFLIVFPTTLIRVGLEESKKLRSISKNAVFDVKRMTTTTAGNNESIFISLCRFFEHVKICFKAITFNDLTTVLGKHFEGN